MRRLHGPVWGSILATAIGAILASAPAQAETELYNKDGWSFHTTGRVAAAYQFIAGDSDPDNESGQQIGGKLVPSGAQNDTDNQIALSRVRSDFLGTSIGFAMRREVNESLYFDSLVNVRLQGISSARGGNSGTGGDFNEAWAAAHTPFGTFRFGRMLSIFGSASGEVLLIAYRHSVGHPCLVQNAGLACGTFGAGPIFADYDAELRYESPRLGGFQFKFSVQDPESTPDYLITPQPRVDAELSYELELGAEDFIVATVQGMRTNLARYVQNPETFAAEREEINPFGLMGAIYGEVGPITAGGGYWQGSGIGVRTVLEIQDQANPLGYEPTAGGQMRVSRGYFGNLAFTYEGTTIAAGTGSSFVKATPNDLLPESFSVLKQAKEWHVTAKHAIDAMTISLEYTNWTTVWLRNERSNIVFAGVAASYEW